MSLAGVAISVGRKDDSILNRSCSKTSVTRSLGHE